MSIFIKYSQYSDRMRKNSVSLRQRHFGKLESGEEVTAYTLDNPDGLEVEFMTFGGIVTRMLAPNRDGVKDDVVLGFNSFEPYLASHPYFGAIAGRVAGRTTGAQFSLNGQVHALAVNDPPNHLHGGIQGFDKRLWDAEPVKRDDGSASVRLSRLSPDGEEGYPGNLEVSVTYTVTPDNHFVIESAATTDRATPVSLTHHSYFNLAGEGSGTVCGHTWQVHADSYCPTDEFFGLTDRREPVDPLLKS